jgi:hypothetical protein
MNRGVMVTRGDPTERELELSARGICSNKENDPVRERLEGYFQPLAKSYVEICKKQRRQFFGLRDFYRWGRSSVHTLFFYELALVMLLYVQFDKDDILDV